VLGVSGPRSLPDDEGTTTILCWSIIRRSIWGCAKYLAAQEAALEQSRHPSARRAEIPGAPNVHVLGETFHSMAAIRYGDFIAKLSAAPLSESVRALTAARRSALGPGALSALAAEFFATMALNTSCGRNYAPT